jgi:hypothetical protein
MATEEEELSLSGSFFFCTLDGDDDDDWRMNIASMPSLRFCTGSINVGDSAPTFPTSFGTG